MHKARIYKGYEIFHCDQTSLGQCDYRGWHIQTIHEATGMKYAEEYCPKFHSLADAHEGINIRIDQEEE